MLILKTNFSLECIKCSRSSFVASEGHGQFEWLAFDTDQRLLHFKLNSFFDLCQVAQGCLLFQWFGISL